MSPSLDAQRVEDACNTLIEHFDSVQIFATRYEPNEADGTMTFSCGAGNYYARYGQVREWLEQQDCRSKRSVIRQDEEEDDRDRDGEDE